MPENLGYKDGHHYGRPTGGEKTLPHGQKIDKDKYKYTGYRDINGDYIVTVKNAEEIEEIEEMNELAMGALEAFYGVATEAARKQMERADKLWDIYTTEYLPGELNLVRESFAGIPVEQALGAASSDVQASYDKALDIGERNLGRYGISPESPQYQSLMANNALARAAAEAGARNLARSNIRDVNYQRRLTAANMGKNLPSQSGALTSSGAGIMGQGASALAGQANLLGDRAFNVQQGNIAYDRAIADAHRQRQAASQSAIWNAGGSLLGAGLGALSGGALPAIGGALGGLFAGSNDYAGELNI